MKINGYYIDKSTLLFILKCLIIFIIIRFALTIGIYYIICICFDIKPSFMHGVGLYLGLLLVSLFVNKTEIERS